MVVYRSCSPSYVIRNALLIIIRGACVVSNNNNKMLGNKGTKKFYRTGGTRGGLDQFKWDDVKSDKDRENYLGHSVLAPVGRWQKGKDLFWYAKKGDASNAALEEEKRRIKEMDDDLINSTLGYKTNLKKDYETSLDSVEIKQYLSKGQVERVETDVERIKGLGAAPAKFHEHIEKVSYVEKEINRIKTGGIAVPVPTFLPGSSSISKETSRAEGKEQTHEEDEKKSKKKKRDRDDRSTSSKEKRHKSEKKHKKEHKKERHHYDI